MLAIFVQALSPNKFVGWAIMVRLPDLDHRAVQPRASSTSSTATARGIGVPLSDMNGQGDFAGFAGLVPTPTGRAFAVILLVLAYGLWRRGTETRLLAAAEAAAASADGPGGR